MSQKSWELFDPYMERLDKALPCSHAICKARHGIVVKYFLCPRSWHNVSFDFSWVETLKLWFLSIHVLLLSWLNLKHWFNFLSIEWKVKEILDLFFFFFSWTPYRSLLERICCHVWYLCGDMVSTIWSIINIYVKILIVGIILLNEALL